MNKQVIFMDGEGNVQGGIYVPDLHYIICGCCGGLVDEDDAVIIHCYNEWLDISESIYGDDGTILHEIEEKLNNMSTEDIQAILDGKKGLNV